jgi:hypothetical protein
MRTHSPQQTRRWAVPGLLLLCSFLLSGCSSGKAKVTGKVTSNNQPLPGGTIVFVPEAEGASGGGSAPIIDGEYTLTSSVPGKMKVYVVLPSGPPVPVIRGGGAPPGIGGGIPKDDPNIPKEAVSGGRGKALPPMPKILPKYLNANLTDYTVEIKKGSQELDIDFK